MWNRVKKKVLDAYSEIRWDNTSNPYSISNVLSPSPLQATKIFTITTGKFLFTLIWGRWLASSVLYI